MKYIFFDIDGTLIGEKNRIVYPSTYKAIELLQKNDHKVFLATGRACFRALELAKEIGISSLVCEGGKCLISDYKVVSYTEIDQEKCLNIIKECERLKLAYTVSIDDSSVRYATNKESFDYFNSIPNLRVFMSVEYKDIDYSKVSIRRIFIENTDDKYLNIEDVKYIGHMFYPGSKFSIIEPDDKYEGIIKMVQLLNGNLEDVVVFGDGINDIKMFKKAPFRIAMGNGVKELKQLADYVTDDADNDGIYNACLKMGWIND